MSDTELLPKSKPEPVRRLEVFTGSGRRRAWTAEQKMRIIAETHESGETYRTLCFTVGNTNDSRELNLDTKSIPAAFQTALGLGNRDPVAADGIICNNFGAA